MGAFHEQVDQQGSACRMDGAPKRSRESRQMPDHRALRVSSNPTAPASGHRRWVRAIEERREGATVVAYEKRFDLIGPHQTVTSLDLKRHRGHATFRCATMNCAIFATLRKFSGSMVSSETRIPKRRSSSSNRSTNPSESSNPVAKRSVSYDGTSIFSTSEKTAVTSARRSSSDWGAITTSHSRILRTAAQ